MRTELTEGDALIPYRLFVGSLIPEWLEKDETLSAAEKLCYARLARYAGKNGSCHPSLRTLGNALGVSERTAKKYVKTLKAKGLVRAQQRGLGRTNAYTFLVSPMMQAAPLLDGGTLEVSTLAPRQGEDGHSREDEGITQEMPDDAHIRESREESHPREKSEGESNEEILPREKDGGESVKEVESTSGPKSDEESLILETLKRDCHLGTSRFPYAYRILVLEDFLVPQSRRFDIRSELKRLLETMEVPTEMMNPGDLLFGLDGVAEERQAMLPSLVKAMKYLYAEKSEREQVVKVS